jgi:hypothetical protein
VTSIKHYAAQNLGYTCKLMEDECSVAALGKAAIQLAKNTVRGRLLQTRQRAFSSTKRKEYLDFFH